MGAKKYGNELRRNIRERHSKGESYSVLSKVYNIPIKSIEYICVNEENSGTRGCMEHVKRDDSAYIDAKFSDAKVFKSWRDKLIKKLKEEMMFKDQPIIYVGPSEFTYRSKKGYNVTKVYVDLYAKRNK